MIPKLIFIGGYGRSGSTLLDRILGQVDGFVSVGEIRHLPQEGLVENRLCGCGEAFSECPFWGAVLTTADLDGLALGDLMRTKKRVDRFFRIPQIIAGRPRSFDRDLASYSRCLGDLYRGITEVSGANVVIDSTKDVSHGYILSRMEEIDLRVIHLVRDSRAVAYSWQRKKFNPGSGRDMERYGLLKTGMEWTAINGLMSGLGRFAPRLVVRYEDLVGAPRETIGGILDFVGEGARRIPVDSGGRVVLGTDHTAAGNPIRFKNGPIDIAADDEWQNRMSPRSRRVVTALTWPGLSHYRT